MAENANVRVVINALTEAAEQSIDDVGDEITGLSDDAAIGQTAVDQLSDEFGEATAQSMILQSALEELEDDMDGVAKSGLYAQTAMDQFNDELTETTTSSTVASGALSSLQASLAGSAAASTALSVAFKLSLIPAVMTLATLIAPLVALFATLTAGAFALAGALGAIVGSGILAFGQKKAKQNKKELAQTKRLIAQYESIKQQTGALTAQQKQRLEQLRKKKKRLEGTTTAMGALKNVMSNLKDELVPLISSFGEDFVPLIEDALNAVPTLVERMLDAVGGTEDFRKALRDFGAVAMTVIPALTGFMFDLARDALPVAREFFSFLLSEGPGAMNAMFASVKQLEPELRNLLDALIEFAPVLLEFGTTAAEVVLPALTDLIRASTTFMAAINGLPGGMSEAAAAGLILAPVLLKIVSVVSSLLTFFTGGGILAGLGTLGTYLAGLVPSAFQLGMAFQFVVEALSAGASAIAGSTTALAAVGAAVGLLGVKLLQITGIMDMVRNAGAKLGQMLGPKLTSHLLTFLSVASFGLFPLLAAIGAAINKLVQGDLKGAAKAFKQVMGIFTSAFQTTWNSIVAGLNDLKNKIVNAFMNSLKKVANAADKLPGVDAPDISTMENVSVEQSRSHPRGQSTETRRTERGGSDGDKQVIQGGINVDVDARGDVQNNPYQWSRKAAQQLKRETRQKHGSN